MFSEKRHTSTLLSFKILHGPSICKQQSEAKKIHTVTYDGNTQWVLSEVTACYPLPVMATQQEVKLGKQIQKLRKDAHLTQGQLAEKVGVSTKYIQYIEAAHRNPTLKTLYKIASVLKVKVSDLFTF